MNAYRQHSTFETGYDFDDDMNGLDPGQRIGAPLRRRRSLLLRGAVVIALAASCGVAAEKTYWPGWTQTASDLAVAAAELVKERIENASVAGGSLQSGPRGNPKPEPQADAASDMAAASKPTETAPNASADGSRTAAAAEPPAAPAPAVETKEVVAAAEPPKAATYDQPIAVQPPAARDPIRARAEAAGLHPDLSSAVLAKLSKADLRNAQTAIERALAETPDDRTYSWPRQRKPDLALFEIHFVPGAAPTCRRYVVTIAKDGWLTTALPMERCGLPRGAKPA